MDAYKNSLSRRALLSAAATTSLLAVGASLTAEVAVAADFNETLPSGATLASGQSVWSPNRQFRLYQQSDGNLVLYFMPFNKPMWASVTSGKTGAYTVMQGDGNLVQYYGNPRYATWSSKTDKHSESYLQLQNDGNAVIYTPGNNRVAIWSTDTYLRPHRYPSYFNPSTAASWAYENYNTRDPYDPSDPCTAFVSRSIAAGGLPEDRTWYRNSALNAYMGLPLSRQWNVVQDLRSRLGNMGVISTTQIDPRIPSSAAFAWPGDLIYYEWNGVPSGENVHFVIITGFAGATPLVTEQSGTRKNQSREWHISYIEPTKTLLQRYPKLKAYVLHWI